MFNWCIAVFLIGAVGVVGCRQDAASPSREAAPSETVSEVATAETPAPPPATITVDTQTPQAPVVTSTAKPRSRSAAPTSSIRSFAVYALSRVKGVPPEAREALRRVVELAEEDQRRGVKVTVTTTRIGIEGETRVCFAYEDPKEGTRAYERARDIVRNVDLVNLVVEPCEAANNQQENE